MKAIINARVVFPDRVVDGGGILFDEDGILASGRIKVPEGVETVDARGMYVGPGLVDEHLHGYQQYGEAFNVVDACREVAKAHLKHGTTTMTPSAAYNLSREDFLSVISQCNQAIREGGTTIAGVHFEGPFTNPRYGSKAERAWQYSDAVCREIFDRAGRNVLHCTYAPEMECAPSLEALLAERGVIADIGHTCAGGCGYGAGRLPRRTDHHAHLRRHGALSGRAGSGKGNGRCAGFDLAGRAGHARPVLRADLRLHGGACDEVQREPRLSRRRRGLYHSHYGRHLLQEGKRSLGNLRTLAGRDGHQLQRTGPVVRQPIDAEQSVRQLHEDDGR
ncbi:MAG: N-acetylglucosamine-6-phosphate deacetylase [Clostridia bacterium]|nr:N-acetylglucosamine-6-phosphate deacetylase [Clostridia bacterium]